MISLGIRDWGLGISTVAWLTLAMPAFAQMTPAPSPNPARPARRTSPAEPAPPTRPSNPTNPPKPTNPNEVALPPIECWWKTDRNAVRVGERFLLTLTCAVLDTERVRVVVDESGLAPSALHLVPFDVIGGDRFRDIQNAPRRFFQYQYTMRVLGEEFFGKEISLPRLQISYRVQNSLQGGVALAGREAQYSLVPVPIRVVSLVPPGTGDIRDTPAETFGDVDRRLFRSNVFLIVGALAFVLAVLLTLMLVARAAVKRRAAVAARPRAVSPTTALGAVARELAVVRAASQREGWTTELAGRAAAALRLAGAVALSRPIGEKEVDRRDEAREGQVAVPFGLRTLKGKKLLLSAAVTPGSADGNGNTGKVPALWTPISQSLAAFSEAHYSANGVDGTALDVALAEARDAVRRLRLSQLVRFGRSRRRTATETARPTWAR